MSDYIEILQFSESRFPKEGEWYRSNNGGIQQAQTDTMFAERPIVTRTHIEIPEGATFFEWGFVFTSRDIPTENEIPLPQPKPKRCRWILRSTKGREWATIASYTREEIKEDVRLLGLATYEPIPGTEE